MGWNDHMDDGNELGNLPPEAFSSWHVDGEFEPEDQWLRTASKDHQIIAVRAWFLDRYCDPALNTPHNGRAGGYQFVHGGPYDPADVLPNRFARAVEDEVIQEVIDELHGQVGDEWAPVRNNVLDDYDEDYGVDIENGDQPLQRLRERLSQSKQVLTLQGEVSAQALARNLSFVSVITSLESFLSLGRSLKNVKRLKMTSRHTCKILFGIDGIKWHLYLGWGWRSICPALNNSIMLSQSDMT